MNENGFYDGWTDHTLTVRPSLVHGIELEISGRNRNDIKEYLHETFHSALFDLIDWNKEQSKYFSVSMEAAAAEYQRKVKDGEII